MQGVILQAIILLVTNIDLSIMDNIGSAVEYLTWVAEEVIQKNNNHYCFLSLYVCVVGILFINAQ